MYYAIVATALTKQCHPKYPVKAGYFFTYRNGYFTPDFVPSRSGYTTIEAASKAMAAIGDDTLQVVYMKILYEDR